MARSKADAPELREQAQLVAQGLTLDAAALRLTIPKRTLANP